MVAGRIYKKGQTTQSKVKEESHGTYELRKKKNRLGGGERGLCKKDRLGRVNIPVAFLQGEMAGAGKKNDSGRENVFF